MPDRHPLLEIEKIDTDIEPYLNRIGEIFRAFRFHDSGCTSLGGYGEWTTVVRQVQQHSALHNMAQTGRAFSFGCPTQRAAAATEFL